MRAAVQIALKDLRQRLRDSSAIIIAVLAPLGLAFVLNATIGGAASGNLGLEFAYADQDGGEVADAFREVLSSLEADDLAEVVPASSADEARRLVDADEVTAAIIVPDGFSEAARTGQDTSLIVVVHPDRPIGGQVAASIARGFAAEIDAVQLAVATVGAVEGSTPDPGRIEELAMQAAKTTSPVEVTQGETDEGGIDFTTFYAIGIAVFFVFFTVQYGILGLIEEKENGTMTRLIAAPIHRWAIVAGKLIASFVLGFVSMVVLWIATTLLMGAEWGDPLGVIVLIVTGVLAAMGIAALSAMVATTAEQAGSISSAFAVVLGILGGVFFPVSQVSGVFSYVSRLTPHRWLMDGFRDLSAGGGMGDILIPVAAVLVFAAITGGIGLSLAGRKVTAT